MAPKDDLRINLSTDRSSQLECMKCGHKNPAGVEYCTKCSAKMTLKCVNCGFKSPQGSGFCGKCGKKADLGMKRSAYSYLAEVLVDKYDVDKDKIRPEATLIDLGLDSLMVVEFLFDVEDEFNIEVPDDRAEFETLNEAATLIDELIEAKGD